MAGRAIAIKVENNPSYDHYIGKKLVDAQIPQEGKVLMSSLPPNNRLFAPDSAGTMDYQPNRLNIYVDEHYIIKKVSWG